jgi:hypothetical protein
LQRISFGQKTDLESFRQCDLLGGTIVEQTKERLNLPLAAQLTILKSFKLGIYERLNRRETATMRNAIRQGITA